MSHYYLFYVDLDFSLILKVECGGTYVSVLCIEEQLRDKENNFIASRF